MALSRRPSKSDMSMGEQGSSNCLTGHEDLRGAVVLDSEDLPQSTMTDTRERLLETGGGRESVERTGEHVARDFRNLKPTWLLLFFCSINMINYVDRGMIASNGVNGSTGEDCPPLAPAPANASSPGIPPPHHLTDCGPSGIQGDFQLSNFQDGLLPTAFLVGLLVASPLFAHASKAHSPALLMALGLAIWCAAVIGCGASWSILPLLVCRMLVGVGEASFVSLAAPCITDAAPASKVSLWLAFFYLCIPVGFALGFIYGGIMAPLAGWRAAFFLEALLMAPFVVFLIHCYYQSRQTRMLSVAPLQENTGLESGVEAQVSKSESGAPGVVLSGVPEDLEKKEGRCSISGASTEHLLAKEAKGSSSGASSEHLLERGCADGYMPSGVGGIPEQGPQGAHGTQGAQGPQRSHRTQGAQGNQGPQRHQGNEGTLLADLWLLVRNPVYMRNVMGYSAFTFVLGAYAFWGPKAMRDLYETDKADAIFGGITVLTGVGGTLAGGMALDYLGGSIHSAFKLMAVVTFIGGTFALMAFMASSLTSNVILLCISELFLFATQSPANLVAMQSVPPVLRSLAIAFSTIAIHVFGDVPSPPLLGLLQDSFGSFRLSMAVFTVVFLPASILWYSGSLLCEKPKAPSEVEASETQALRR